ncbi:MAG: hypothetical protein MUE73_04490 [Planctomycetes bacterium]|nr:hypothetical protein [Planctomycetota bacterium]
MPKSLILGFVIGGLAVVAAIVVLASSGGMPKSEIEAAQAAFRSLIGHCLENRAEAGIPLLDVQMMLRYEKPDEFKKWKDMTPEQRTGLGPVAFDSVREKVGKLGIKDPAGADALLAAAVATPDSRTMQVQYEMKAGEVSWNATLSKRDSGWQLVRLDAIR